MPKNRDYPGKGSRHPSFKAGKEKLLLGPKRKSFIHDTEFPFNSRRRKPVRWKEQKETTPREKDSPASPIFFVKFHTTKRGGPLPEKKGGKILGKKTARFEYLSRKGVTTGHFFSVHQTWGRPRNDWGGESTNWLNKTETRRGRLPGYE